MVTQITSTEEGTRFLGAPEVERLTSITRWTLWRWEKENKFPRSVRLASKRVWIESEIRAWMAERVAAREKPNVETDNEQTTNTSSGY